MRPLYLFLLLVAALLAGACSSPRFMHDPSMRSPVNRSARSAMRARTNRHRDYHPARHYQFKKEHKPTYRVHLKSTK